jgi:hypothetical protein
MDRVLAVAIQQIPPQTVPGAMVGVCTCLINLPSEVLEGTAEQAHSFFRFPAGAFFLFIFISFFILFSFQSSGFQLDQIP